MVSAAALLFLCAPGRAQDVVPSDADWLIRVLVEVRDGGGCPVEGIPWGLRGYPNLGAFTDEAGRAILELRVRAAALQADLIPIHERGSREDRLEHRRRAAAAHCAWMVPSLVVVPLEQGRDEYQVAVVVTPAVKVRFRVIGPDGNPVVPPGPGEPRAFVESRTGVRYPNIFGGLAEPGVFEIGVPPGTPNELFILYTSGEGSTEFPVLLPAADGTIDLGDVRVPEPVRDAAVMLGPLTINQGYHVTALLAFLSKDESTVRVVSASTSQPTGPFGIAAGEYYVVPWTGSRETKLAMIDAVRAGGDLSRFGFPCVVVNKDTTEQVQLDLDALVAAVGALEESRR